MSLEKEKNNGLNVGDKLNIYGGRKQNIVGTVKSIDLLSHEPNVSESSNLSEEAREYFLSRSTHLQSASEYKKNKYLELKFIELDNGEKIYFLRMLKYFGEGELDDTIYIYDERRDGKRIGHSNLIKVLSGKAKGNIRISYHETVESEEGNGYGKRRLLLMNYLSNKYFGQNIKNIYPVTGTEGVFNSLIKKGCARLVKEGLYDMLDPKDNIISYYLDGKINKKVSFILDL